jgi:hypothetical protein
MCRFGGASQITIALCSAKRVNAKPYPDEQLWSENVNYAAPIRRGWWYSLLAIPGLLVGIGVFAYFLWNGLKSVTASLTQVVVPDRVELNVMSLASFSGAAVHCERQDLFKLRFGGRVDVQYDQATP